MNEPEDVSRYPEVRGWGVYVKKGRLGSGGVITVHNEEWGGCSHTPKRNDYTDLVTATVAVDAVRLCSYCEWPDGAEKVLLDEHSLHTDNNRTEGEEVGGGE